MRQASWLKGLYRGRGSLLLSWAARSCCHLRLASFVIALKAPLRVRWTETTEKPLSNTQVHHSNVKMVVVGAGGCWEALFEKASSGSPHKARAAAQGLFCIGRGHCPRSCQRRNKVCRNLKGPITSPTPRFRNIPRTRCSSSSQTGPVIIRDMLLVARAPSR